MPVKLERSILKVLVYFDLFNYPLLQEEIHFFLDQRVTPAYLSQILEQLAASHQIHQQGHFFSLRADAQLPGRRIAGNQHARSLLITAYKIGAFLYQFPFVRGIGISGSLSKDFADEKADIDFFIITRSNRLWIARTCMHLFKKLSYLAGRQHWFCMNYYIDEEALLIGEQNIFTATELVTLKPVCGNGSMDRFFEENNWTNTYFPNARPQPHPAIHHHSSFKRFLEWCFNNRLGDRLDNFLMRLTTKRWQQKEAEQRVNEKGNRMALRTGKHFSKPNPANFQHQVLQRFKIKMEEVLSNENREVVNEQ
jgi:hypothetical protein